MRISYLHLTGCAFIIVLGIGCATAAPDENDDHLTSSQSEQTIRSTASMVYTIENDVGANYIIGLHRDSRTGELSTPRRYATGGTSTNGIGGFEQHSLVANRHFLYAVNPGSDDVSAFAIGSDGTLRLIGKTPSGGRHPAALALHPAGLLFVANEGGIPLTNDPTAGSYSVLRIRLDGSLAPVSGGVYSLPGGAHPSDILVSPDGQRVIAPRLEGGTIDSFQIGPGGRLVSTGSVRDLPGPFGGAFLPAAPDKFVFSLSNLDETAAVSGVATYELRPGSAPSEIDLDNNLPVDACWTVFSPDGLRLWVSAFLLRSITEYSVSLSGHLTRRTAVLPEDSEVQGATDLAMDSFGRNLYELRPHDITNATSPQPHIQVYSIGNGTKNAGLTLVQDLLLSSVSGTAGIMGLVVVDL
jgi:hypothetical protein